jgi:plastocyanin
MTRQGFARAAGGLIGLALVLVACGGAKKAEAPTLTNKLSITGSEYKFDVSKPSVNEGTLQVTFTNAGQEMHMVAWGKLKAGVTFDKFSQTLQTKQDEAFGMIEEANDGSPGVLSPGRATTLTTGLLKAGTYGLLCFLPAPDGTPHVAKGMVGSVEVKAAATPAPSPFNVASDGEVSMTEYTFGTLPKALTDGKGTVKFTNAGKEAHEATIVRLEDGKTIADVDKYFKAFEEGGPPPAGPPPAKLMGGFFSIDPGAAVWLTFDLPPGKYVMDCGEERKDGKNHGDLGMRAEFTVA